MDYNLKEVAGRIKDLREAKGYTPEELAKLTGVSVEDYKLLEEGESDFSFTFIYKCAKACGVEVVDLLEGTSTTLTSFAITRKGEGLKIIKKQGVVYNNLAPKFKDKLAEPFLVKFPYLAEEQNAPIKLNSHNGQEFDVIVKGSLKVQVGNHVDILNEGDSIFYNSIIPHGMIAVSEGGCEFHAVVLNPQDGHFSEEYPEAPFIASKAVKAAKEKKKTVADNFITSTYDDNGVFNGISFKNDDKFNFAFDCVDAIAKKDPDKLAMMWVANDKTDRRFTFSDMKKYSAKTANYFESLGIKKGDTVMLVLKRHYQFWFCMLALHKIGAIAIPATNQLVEHDFEYRYKAAGVKAIVCTADGDVSVEAEKAAAAFPDMIKVLVGGKKDGWHDFNVEMERFSTHFDRTENTPCGDDPMLMLFTSGTTSDAKAVMLSQHNIVTNIMAMGSMVEVRGGTCLSILPLHHTYECTCGFLYSVYGGCTVAFCEGLRYVQQNMCEAKVTYVLTVPLLVETMYNKIWANIDKTPGLRKKVETIIKVNNAARKVGIDMSRKLFKQIHSAFGGELELFVVGAAPMNPEVSKGLYDLGIRVRQGYGLTECAPIIALGADTYARSADRDFQSGREWIW